MGRITWQMENNGDTIILNNAVPKDYFKERGARGFGISNTYVRFTEGAGGGGRHRNTRRGMRNIDMPIIFFGDDGQEIEDKMRRLARLMQDKYSTPKLVAIYPNGSRYETSFHYRGGADPQMGEDGHETWARWVLALQCPDPYWTAADAVTYALTTSSEGRGLLNTSLSKLQVSSSQTLGSLEINNPGDVDAKPVWNIRGPGDSFTATRADGRSFSYVDSIGSSDVITVDVNTKKVTDQNGDNKYNSLGPAPKLFTIPAGTSTISVLLENATSDSLISMYFRPRRELVFG